MKMRMGERKREGKREREGQTKNKQRNACREWNKPKRCPEKKKAINQTKHNHKKFQNLALTTFFLLYCHIGTEVVFKILLPSSRIHVETVWAASMRE